MKFLILGVDKNYMLTFFEKFQKKYNCISFISSWNNINESSIIDYMVFLTKKMQCEICTEEQQPYIKNIVRCEVDGLTNLSNWLTAVATEELRAKLIETGYEQGARFLAGQKV